ncbi:MAG: hypothetical protein D4R43_02710 [Sphingobacteriales bacterium]|nr:MAG: hypothetical protein D4R43_02710 [Sphingobacteriales bacterium]
MQRIKEFNSLRLINHKLLNILKMKTTIITFLFLFSLISIQPINAHAQKHKVVDLGDYILDTLGLSIAEKSDPNAAKERTSHNWVAYWNVPGIIFEYDGKSASPSELLKFLQDKKNYKKIETVLGNKFCLIAADSKNLISVSGINGKITFKQYPNIRESESLFFMNDQYYLKKKL